jgi:hypothetical protein
MPTTQDTLRTLVQLEGADTYVRGLRSIGTTAESVAEKQRRLAESYRMLSLGMAGAAAASIGVIAYLAKQASAFEAYRNKLEIATKSTAKASEVFAWSKNYANVTPFETGAVVDAAARLEMYGMTAQKWLPLAGDMAGAMGRDITQAVEAIADAISGGGLERLKEFGLGSQQLKAAGWTGSYQDVQGIETLKKALADLIGTRFLGGADRMAETLIGRISTLKGEFSTLAASIGEDLQPQIAAMVNNGIALVRWLSDASPATKGFVADALKIAAIGTTVGAVTFKLKSLSMEYAANRSAVMQNTVAQRAETAAVRDGVVAYNEKAHAMARASLTPKSAPTAAGGSARGDMMRAAQQTIGFTLATNAASNIDWTGDWSLASSNVQNLGRMAGYAAGAFNPLILAATAAADGIGYLVEYIQDMLLSKSNKAASEGFLGPNGAPLTEEQLRKQYRDMPERERAIIPEDVYVRRGLQMSERARASMEQKAAAATRATLAEQVGNELATSGYGAQGTASQTDALKANLDAMRRSNKEATDYITNSQSIGRASQLVAGNLRAEALQHQSLEQGYRRQAALTDDATKRAQLLASAEKERTTTLQKQLEAQEVLADHEERIQSAREQMAEQARKLTEQARRDEEERRNAQLATANARAGYAEQLYGAGSPEAVDAHKQAGALLSAESLQAAMMGDLAKSYQLATQALKEMRYEQEAVAAAMRKTLDTGSAYAEYLRSIGRDKEAEQYERNTMAANAAMAAQQAFGGGDYAAGYRYAAQAETLARSGMTGKGGTIGGKKRTAAAGRALTDALSPSVLQAAQNQPIVVQVRQDLRVEDGFVNAKKLKSSFDKSGYFAVHAQ